MTQVPIEQALQVAIAHHQAGRLTEAESIYRQILSVRPDHAEALNLLGAIAGQRGRVDSAIELIRQAIAAAPDNPIYRFHLGTHLQSQGRLDEAITGYQRALSLRADYPEALINLGNVWRTKRQFDQAIACYQRALEFRPDYADACNNLGNAWKDKGRLDLAIASYQRAIALQPQFAQAYTNLGNAWYDLGQLDRAIDFHQRALAINSRMVETHVNLGNAWRDKNQLDKAIACHQKALALSPDCADAHHNLGVVLQEKGQIDQSIACYQRALAIKPDLVEAHSNLGNAWKDQGQLDHAIACFERALALDPQYVVACDNLLTTLQYHPRSDARSLFDANQNWSRQYAQPLQRFQQPHGNGRDPERRLRIGYVSADFCDNVCALYILPLLHHHDRGKFDVACYAQVAFPDSFTKRMRDCVPHWRSIMGLSDAQAASLVREDQIDILIDLKLHTAQNRLLVFAHKPAPIQVTWLGYPGTTGMDSIDYRLTDPCLDPPGLDDAFYSERSIRLPDTFWCYDPLSGEPDVNALPCQQNEFVTFGCLNNFCKINIDVLGLWGRVLSAVPGSRLLLLAPQGSARQPLLDRLAADGIDSSRIECVARQPRPEYLHTYHRIDIALDTFPYNGHTTSLDSFWMGVPVITLAGKTAVGRAGVSQLTNLGLTELIAHTPEQYVQKTVDLATDRPRLAGLRAELRHRMQTSPLMDAARFARSIENAYRTMWRTWCAS